MHREDFHRATDGHGNERQHGELMTCSNATVIAVARGCDVDKPRNLAKSVTVE